MTAKQRYGAFNIVFLPVFYSLNYTKFAFCIILYVLKDISLLGASEENSIVALKNGALPITYLFHLFAHYYYPEVFPACSSP